jgi:hypothetical protein
MADDVRAEVEIAATQVQASTDRELSGEVINHDRVVTLAGQDFRVAEKVGLMPLLKFSHAAELRANDSRAYVAMYEILRDVIMEAEEPCGECAACKEAGDDPTARDCIYADEGDWGKFQEHAVTCKCEAEELFDVVEQAIKVISARPTGSPSSSADGSRRTSRNSTAGNSAKRGAASKPSPRGRRATSR